MNAPNYEKSFKNRRQRAKDRWEKRPKWYKAIFVAVMMLVVIAVLALVFGFIIQWLWNDVMTAVFSLPAVTYWQAVGLFALARFLFGCSWNYGAKKRKKDNRDPEEEADTSDDWKFYDEWWQSEGKKAFDDYMERKDGK